MAGLGESTHLEFSSLLERGQGSGGGGGGGGGGGRVT